jgi:hypothetical protein
MDWQKSGKELINGQNLELQTQEEKSQIYSASRLNNFVDAFLNKKKKKKE